MVLATNLGFPRIGKDRELKKALEAFWKGKSSEATLIADGKALRARHWKLQQEAGLDHIPSNDFSFYDQVLDMACTLGCVPERYGWKGGNIDLATYFAMARGSQKDGVDVTAMEMTKWFDTNYHYIVPEFHKDQKFTLSSSKIFDEFSEAKALGIITRPVLIGPLTFSRLGKKREGEKFCRCTLVPALTPVYIEILKKLKDLGAEWVQIDEPSLATDLEERHHDAAREAYRQIRAAVPGIKIMLTTYFDALGGNAELAYGLPVDGIHLDLRRAPEQFDQAMDMIGDKVLSLGIIDGRNIWRNNLSSSLSLVEKSVKKLGSDKVCVAPSCSLLHTPVDLEGETDMDPQIRSWMAFARQKLGEIAVLARAVNKGREAVQGDLEQSNAVQDDRKTSTRIHSRAVKGRAAGITEDMKKRKSPFKDRAKLQHTKLNLPLYPTTTIGSFPQTQEIRKARADYKKGATDLAAYKKAMQGEIQNVVDFQLEIDIDVLVHGEPERNDMVEYFGEQLDGFVFSKNGWVQSYGSRCVKPPIIYGDVSRPQPMTVEWAEYAQSLTSRPMKGMLTGPITILQWSFVRDDQMRSDTARQIALAIRDEVQDLEKAGIGIIQIDEAAIREGLPLRKADWQDYLDWAVECFRISASGVDDKTQIHTHMCYSEFNDIIESIGEMDADVISIETSRSQMELLRAFVAYKYPNEIGPGVYDIHSPRIPGTEEMITLLEKAAKVIDPKQIWVNPDCGLKTRGWAEVKPALEHMVSAAKHMRDKAKGSAAA